MGRCHKVSHVQPVYRSFGYGGLSAILDLSTVLALLFLLAPVVIVIVISFSADSYLQFPPSGFSVRWYANFFVGDPTWVHAARKSFVVATSTAIIATVLGTLVAIPLARGGLRGHSMIEALLLSPLIISPMITAVALYGFFAGVGLIKSIFALILGHSILALPYAVMNVSVSAKALDPRLEQAAMGLGARPVYVFRRVTIPLLAPGIIAGAFFAFLASFDEVVIALFLSGLDPTLQKRMWDDIRLEINPTVAAASTVLVAVSLVAFSAAILLQRFLARRIAVSAARDDS